MRFPTNTNFNFMLRGAILNLHVHCLCLFAFKLKLTYGIMENATAFRQLNNALSMSTKTFLKECSAPVMFLFLEDTKGPTNDVMNFISFEQFNYPQLLFTNTSRIPRRNSYFPWEKVSPVTIGKFLPTFVAPIVFMTQENFDIVISLSLQHVTRVDLDIFIIVGEEQLLRNYFLTPLGMKLRRRIGVVFSCCNETSEIISNEGISTIETYNVTFLIDPPIYKDGEMEMTQIVPKQLPPFSLNGRNLRVSANTLAPYIVFTSPTNITGGTHYMMLMLSAANYNFSLIWDINPTRGNGKLAKDGTANGMLGDVLNDKADIAFIARLTLGQIGVIDLTTSNYVDTLVFLTRKPEVYLEWTAVIHVFTTETWGVILLVFLTLIPLYYLKLHRANSSSKPVRPFKAFMIPFGILITQSVPRIPKRAYPLTLFWMLFVLNMNIAYNSNLSSVLTKLEPETVPMSFDELSKRLDYNISFNYLNNGSCDCFHFFNDSTNPMIISIKERFMHNLEPDTGKCIVRAIIRRKSVCIGWESVAMIGIAQNATLHAGLKLVTVSKSVHSSRNSIGFQRHSLYTKTFDKIFGWLRDMGVVIILKKNAEAAAMDKGQTWLNSRKSSKVYKVLKKFVDDMHNMVRPFELVHFKFAYILFFGGSIFASFIFFLEHMANTNVDRKGITVEYSP